MATKRMGTVRWILRGIGLLLVVAGVVFAGQPTTIPWKCVKKLDQETKSALMSYEKFFAGLYSFPTEYKSAPGPQKIQLIKDWIKTMEDDTTEQSSQAAAYLGMVKARQSVRFIEKTAAQTKNNRLRWIAARSLGQLGDKASIPVLIDLLDNSNKNVRVYARVSLAEITGVYFGDDKEKWKTWKPGKTPQNAAARKDTKNDSNSIPDPNFVSESQTVSK